MIVLFLNILTVVFSFSMLVFLGLSIYYPTKSIVVTDNVIICYTDLFAMFLILDYIVKTILWAIV